MLCMVGLKTNNSNIPQNDGKDKNIIELYKHEEDSIKMTMKCI